MDYCSRHFDPGRAPIKFVPSVRPYVHTHREARNRPSWSPYWRALRETVRLYSFWLQLDTRDGQSLNSHFPSIRASWMYVCLPIIRHGEQEKRLRSILACIDKMCVSLFLRSTTLKIYSSTVIEKKKTSSFNHADHSFTIWRVNVKKKKKRVALIMLIIALMNWS